MFVFKYNHYNRRQISVWVLLMSLFTLPAVNAQDSKIAWSVFDMGFANSSSSNLQLKSVVGQQLVGSISSTTTRLISGFLADTLFRSFVVSVYDISQDIPTTYMLYQNYPNPFNPTTRIRYNIPKASFVTLKVYSILGQEVATLVKEKKEPGRYEVDFEPFAGNLPLASGTYFYRLAADDYVFTRKFLFIK